MPWMPLDACSRDTHALCRAAQRDALDAQRDALDKCRVTLTLCRQAASPNSLSLFLFTPKKRLHPTPSSLALDKCSVTLTLCRQAASPHLSLLFTKKNIDTRSRPFLVTVKIATVLQFSPPFLPVIFQVASIGYTPQVSDDWSHRPCQ